MRERDFGMSAGAIPEIGWGVSTAGKQTSTATSAPAVSSTKYYAKMLQCKGIEITELVNSLTARLSPILHSDSESPICSGSRDESKLPELPELPNDLRHTLGILENLESMVVSILGRVDF